MAPPASRGATVVAVLAVGLAALAAVPCSASAPPAPGPPSSGAPGAHDAARPASPASPAAPARPDTTAVLLGRVVLGESGTPAAGARIEVTGQERTAVTDDQGWFRLEGLAPGPDTVRVTTLPGRSRTRAVELEEGEATEVRIALEPRVVDVGGLEVTVEEGRRTELERLADRIDRGVGEYITRKELRDHHGRLSFAFRGMPGVDVRHTRGGDFRVLLTPGRGACAPQLFVNGSVREYLAVDAYEPEEIAVVEVYTANTVPSEYRTLDSMRCGVVVLWTRRFLREGG